ncbi:MAG TPA: FG-GAP-like repeat-containing protein [Puia sp.]|nr:FG-GAP-like repeat-containing protein [Puia sp.]
MFAVIVLGCFVLLLSCGHDPRNRSHAKASMSSIRQGERLARTYCGSCHLAPDPSLLDSRSWEKGVLPAMGPRLGIFAYGFQLYPNSRRDTNIGKGYYPSQPLLSGDDWQHILDYYTATSPDTLPGQGRRRPIAMQGLSVFDVLEPELRYGTPATTFVRIDTIAGERGVDCYDYNYRKLYRFSPELRVIDSVADSGGIVDMVRDSGEWVSCDIGVLNPNNGKSGKMERILPGRESKGRGVVERRGSGGQGSGGQGSEGQWMVDTPAMFSPLARPVQIAAADLNGDGRMDWVVCEFGNLTGALTWLENKGDGRYERHIIRAAPGAIRVYVNDYNHDGLPDLWVLFAQGDEGIFLFTNQGKGQFKEQAVLRFPPCYGSSYFELVDFNKDGYPDILYTCGDNADFSEVLKPYHGIYIYLNDGQNHFSQRYFFPMNGCYKAVARDFDGDGDLDIAAISFFADYKRQPEEGFVYLENIGGDDFRPYSLPEAERGKWLTMDVADMDGDGKPDIVLGNFSLHAPVTQAGVDFKKGPPFLVLKNRSK